MEWRIEVVTLPVSDVDRALRFYTEQVGFRLDVDYRPNDGFRVVQLTPAGSACSVQLGVGLTDAEPGSARTTYLVVNDIEAAHRELAERGVALSARYRWFVFGFVVKCALAGPADLRDGSGARAQVGGFVHRFELVHRPSNLCTAGCGVPTIRAR